MRTVLLALFLLASSPAWGAEDIFAVLERSQKQQLDALDLADSGSAQAQRVQRSFERLLPLVDLPIKVSLRVVRGSKVAECLLGKVIVANVSLADMSEGERLFALAHELGHVAHGDWSAMAAVFYKHIPDEVVQEKTDAVAWALGREASALAHQQEYAADAFAWQVLARVGESGETALALFRSRPMVSDTATHPGTRKRVAHLRTLTQ